MIITLPELKGFDVLKSLTFYGDRQNYDYRDTIRINLTIFPQLEELYIQMKQNCLPYLKENGIKINKNKLKLIQFTCMEE